MYLLQLVNDERDASVVAQHSDFVTTVIGNPRQPEIVEFREENDSGIDLHHRSDRVLMH